MLAALLLSPLGVAFAMLLLLGIALWHGGIDHPLWLRLFAHDGFRIASFLFMVALLYHAWIGVRDILMDYIKPTGWRLAAQVAEGRHPPALLLLAVTAAIFALARPTATVTLPQLAERVKAIIEGEVRYVRVSTRALKKGLIARGKLHSSDPALHDWTLYVAWPGGQR